MGTPIMDVMPDSIAEELGIEAGDILLSVSGWSVEDILDYRFACQDNEVLLAISKQNGDLWELDIEKNLDEDLGLVFADVLFDRLKVCRNRCIFCFVDQLPDAMRSTLYTKDDDYRLSFLFGNFITLTNMQEADWEKISRLCLSPLYISVHCLDPNLRVKLLGNQRAVHILAQLERLSAAGVRLHTQIVLCPGLNDGPVLAETVAGLAEISGVETVGIVPVGLTACRRELMPLRPVNAEEAVDLIEQVNAWQVIFRRDKGWGFVYLADEFFIKAGQEIPAAAYYDEFEQLENGIGLVRILLDDFEDCQDRLPAAIPEHRISILTGEAAHTILKPLVERLQKIDGLNLTLLPVANTYFGGQVSVTGLLTGYDIINCLGTKYKNQKFLLHDVVLKEKTTVLLDDISIQEIEDRCEIELQLTDGTVADLLEKLLGRQV